MYGTVRSSDAGGRLSDRHDGKSHMTMRRESSTRRPTAQQPVPLPLLVASHLSAWAVAYAFMLGYMRGIVGSMMGAHMMTAM